MKCFFYIDVYKGLTRRPKVNILLCVNVSISKKSVTIDIIYEYFNTYSALPLPKTCAISKTKTQWGNWKKVFKQGNRPLNSIASLAICVWTTVVYFAGYIKL